MNTIASSRIGHHFASFGILLVILALAIGTAGCIIDDIGEPTEIWTWNDLNAVRDDLGGSYVLMSHLDEATGGYDELVGDTADGKGWQPLGTTENPFKGIFDGNGYAISGLFMYRPDEDEVGLLGRVQEGLVKNVGLVGVNVTGRKSVGALVGYSWKGTLDSDTRPPFSKTYAYGSVTGDEDVGGLVGNSYRGIVNQCASSVEVFHVSSTPDEERWRAGGLVGLNSGPVINCNYSGEVNGDRQVGGLVGQNAFAPDARVEDCGGEYGVYGNLEVGGVAGRNLGVLRRASFNGTVKAFLLDGLIALNEDASGSAGFSDTTLLGSYVGGVVGVNEGIVEDCSAQATVEGYRYVGGLTGANNGTVEGCSAQATVKGYQYVGGLAGANAGSLESCSSSGDVTGNSDAGRLVGYNTFTGTMSDSESTSCVTNTVDCGDLVGRDEAEPWDYVIELGLHCTMSLHSSPVNYVYAPWIAEVEALTGNQGGKFHISVTYDEAPFDAPASLEAISSGVVDIGQLYPETFRLGGIGSLPWFLPDMESAAYATYYLFTEDSQKWDMGELSGVKILITSPLWPAQWWGNVDVRIPEDVVGLRIRTPGADDATILALGAIPTPIPTYDDLAAALQADAVDGCFFTYAGWQGFSGIGPNTEYTTELNMFFMTYSLAMNKDVYDALPGEARALLDTVCTAAKSVELAKAHFAGMAEDRALTGGPNPLGTGRTIYVPTTEELEAWKDATANVAGDWVAYMNAAGFDGAGILARAEELIAEYQASASYDNTAG